MATIEGSFMTMPSPRTYTRVLAVPRSMARSLEKRPARKFSSMAVRSRLVAGSNYDGVVSVSPPLERRQDSLCFREDGEHGPAGIHQELGVASIQSFRLLESENPGEPGGQRGPLDHDAERQEHGQHEGPDSAGDRLDREARDVRGDVEVDRDGGRHLADGDVDREHDADPEGVPSKGRHDGHDDRHEDVVDRDAIEDVARQEHEEVDGPEDDHGA